MVLEESMRKMGFLKYLGSFSVVKNSRQVLESLDYAAGLLGDPNNIVVIFPQGKLYSNFVDTLSFEKGILHIAAKAKANFQYIFAANFTENFEHKKPTAHIYLKALNVDEIKPDEIKEQYMRHYQTAKQQQTSIIV